MDDSRLLITLAEDASPDGTLVPRRYTLTHSDRTGHQFVTVGAHCDASALHALQVRLERDEVLGEWVDDEAGPRLDIHMAAQGGLPALLGRYFFAGCAARND
jgi:hypothetical protein